MYALADESREMLLDLYRRSWAFGDQNIRELGLDAPAHVPWWPEERKDTTLGYLVVHMLAETAHHAGHADILRESIDGRGGSDHDDVGDEEHWDGLRGQDPGRGRRAPRRLSRQISRATDVSGVRG